MRLKARDALRLVHINTVLVRHGLDQVILATPLLRPLRFLLYVLPWNWFRRFGGDTLAPRGERIRAALVELGPIFVKFGQMLSTRRDLLPDDVAMELAKLQDRVPPFPGEVARVLIEKAFGKPIHEIFLAFDEHPYASASIAQVHLARLYDGREVIVKVVRPDIEPTIRRDVGLLYLLAELAERYWSEGRRLRPVDIIGEYEKSILDELDLLREAANASQLRRNFLNSPLLYVPEIYWPWTRRSVMVMERISGIPIGDISGLRAAGIDLQLLAERGVEIFFTQVFRHSFFHADMHPGNIFVAPEGRYIAIDFGIMGTLSPTDQRYLAENFAAFFNRDYRRVAELHVQSGWVPQDTRIDEFESGIRAVCEPIFERPLKDISFGQLLLRLFQVARRFNMEVQPQLMLLQKTLLNVEGLGRDLYPELDLWRTAKPVLERWLREQMGPQATLERVTRELPVWFEHLPSLPGMMIDVLRRTQDGRLKFEYNSKEIEELHRTVLRNGRRMYAAVVGGALIIAGGAITGLDGVAPTMWGNAPALGWIAGGLGVWMILAYWPRGGG